MPDNQKTVCYFPGRESSYARNQVIVSALKSAGFQVLDCSGSKRNLLRYLVGFFKFLKNKKRSDIIFIGFLGHFLMPLVKMATRKPVIFDVFVSLYLTMAFDRKKISPNGLLAKIARFFDRIACQLADHIFCDTQQHIDYFTHEYGLDAQKFSRLFVGSNTAVFHPLHLELSRTDNKDFRMHFHGEFQPLHGVETIIHAARMLPEVKFQLIGKGQTRKACEKLASDLDLRNIQFLSPVAYRDLPGIMEQASICLGIFGDTSKANMVIPHKVYEALAMGKPVITADTQAARELLVHKENAFLCHSADAESLAAAIKELKSDPILLRKIAGNGYKTFVEQCSFTALGKEINLIIQSVLNPRAQNA